MEHLHTPRLGGPCNQLSHCGEYVNGSPVGMIIDILNYIWILSVNVPCNSRLNNGNHVQDKAIYHQ